MYPIVLLALATTFSMPIALEQGSPAQETKKQDSSKAVMEHTDFIKKAADSGMKEADAARLATEKSSNSDVKAFAQRLVTDHTNANQELIALARSRKIVLVHDPLTSKPSDPSHATMAGHADMHPTMANLKTLEGAAFDRAFIDQMVKDHQQSVDMFDAQADHGKDSEVKNWAEKKLPTLKEHLKMAKDLQEKVGR